MSDAEAVNGDEVALLQLLDAVCLLGLAEIQPLPDLAGGYGVSQTDLGDEVSHDAVRFGA